jgi:hypothetical protein
VIETSENTAPKREAFILQISYTMPMAGGVRLFAKDKDEAVRVITEAHANMRDFKVIDIHSINEIEEKQRSLAAVEEDDMSDLETSDAEKKVIN